MLTDVKLFPSPATQCMAMVFSVSLRDAGWSSAVVVTIAVVPSPSARCTAMLFTVSFEDKDWSPVFVVVVAVVLSPSTRCTTMLFTVSFEDEGWLPAVVVVRAVVPCPLFFAEEPVLRSAMNWMKFVELEYNIEWKIVFIGDDHVTTIGVWVWELRYNSWHSYW